MTPLVTGAVAATVTEDDAAVTLDAPNASDIDTARSSASPTPGRHRRGGQLRAARRRPRARRGRHRAQVISDTPFDLTNLPPGVSFDAATHAFSPRSDPPGVSQVTVGGPDTLAVTVLWRHRRHRPVGAKAVFTVTGVNDAPVVSGPVTLTVHENGGGVVSTDSSKPGRAGIEALESRRWRPLPNAVEPVGQCRRHRQPRHAFGRPACRPTCRPASPTFTPETYSSPTGYFGAGLSPGGRMRW